MSAELGGDPACWAHLFDEEGEGPTEVGAAVWDLGATDIEVAATGVTGAGWSLPHGGDLDANLVHVAPGEGIGAHVNDEVDVLLLVLSGRGELAVDGTSHRLAAHTLALVPKGAARELSAEAVGITYLSVHRRRAPLGISQGATPPGAGRRDPLQTPG